MSEPDWDLANCQNADTELFFPVSIAESAPARRICLGCEIRQDCAQWAINTGQQFGIWGGMDAKERRAYIRRGLRPVLTIDPNRSRADVVAELAGQGYGDAQIGDLIGCSAGSVKVTRQRKSIPSGKSVREAAK